MVKKGTGRNPQIFKFWFWENFDFPVGETMMAGDPTFLSELDVSTEQHTHTHLSLLYSDRLNMLI